ncbi:helix-turn-helix transcriptional regulator, partial [Bacillus cereus]
DLAKELGVTPSHLSNIENGKYELSYKMRKQLCRLLEEFNLSREQGGA